MINQVLVGVAETPSMRAMSAPAIVVISTRTSSLCREASTYPRVSPSVRPFQLTRMRARSRAIIAGEFLADNRWVPVDISEAWKNPKLADYYFGHNPANRFELTKGRDLVVDPEPESGPINFLVYPLLEMNGEVIKPETTFMFRRIGA